MVDRMEWGRDPVLPRGDGGADEKKIEGLQRRIEKLETENRRWTSVVAVVVAALALGVFVVGRATKPVDTLETRSLALTDKNGNVRARLMLDTGDQPVLVFLDRSARTRLTVGLTPSDQPQFVLAGANEKPRFRAVLPTDNSVSLAFSDRDGVDRAWVGVDRAGMSGITLYNPRGQMQAALSAVSGSLAGLSFFGRKGAERAAFGINGQVGLMRLAGGPGDSTVIVQVAADGLPTISLSDRDRGSRVLLTMAADGAPSLTLRDKKGLAAVVSNGRLLLGKDQTVLWSAP